jgi:hypothetical protein
LRTTRAATTSRPATARRSSIARTSSVRGCVSRLFGAVRMCRKFDSARRRPTTPDPNRSFLDSRHPE